MLFAVDIGNTNVVIAVFDNDRIVTQWRVASDTRRTGDEYSSIILTLARDAGIDVSEFDKAVISSVVPALIGPFVVVCQRVCKVQPLVLTSAMALERKLPVHLPENSTRELGTDLLCNAVAAWEELEHHANIVVDFGTALTLTVTSSSGEILGGTISPGLGTAVKALATNAAQLPFVPLEAPSNVIGATTKGAIQSGVVLGYKGLVESLVSQVKSELVLRGEKDEIRVIATGGLNSVLKPITECFTSVDKDLTVKGLLSISKILQ
ncbi:type III pantothenate kinase [Treponema rectale]|uniref:Type III pantothenate kinase n=1 Tax=Treponema rectale TaxID=744512 RepID=A0A840SCN8_9SPIR|nr:type III pantothenate kinase [Treponema rectale]MBB5218545.1 type III pantothenate kinase [Treponema rectale]QOS39772.1 type III pantothenate kinase [Treponema rectale]